MLLNRHPEQFIPKTDVQDPVAVAASVEQLKRWARAKLKKSSLRDVAGRGGKVSHSSDPSKGKNELNDHI